MLRHRFQIFSAMTLSLLVCGTSKAAEVLRLQGTNQVVLQLSGNELQEGQQAYLIDVSGKKTALIQVQKIKSGKALADVVKGKAAVGLLTSEPLSGWPAGSSATASSGKKKFGAFGSFHIQSMKVPVTTTTSVSMSGNNFGIQGYYDWGFMPKVNVRILAGYEPFVVSGDITTASCTGSKKCSVDLQYFGLGGIAQYNLMEGKTRLWLGGGYELLMAISKSTNITSLTLNSINQGILASVGADFKVGKWTIPTQFDYIYYPGATDVTYSSMVLRAGFGF